MAMSENILKSKNVINIFNLAYFQFLDESVFQNTYSAENTNGILVFCFEHPLYILHTGYVTASGRFRLIERCLDIKVHV